MFFQEQNQSSISQKYHVALASKKPFIRILYDKTFLICIVSRFFTFQSMRLYFCLAYIAHTNDLEIMSGNFCRTYGSFLFPAPQKMVGACNAMRKSFWIWSCFVIISVHLAFPSSSSAWQTILSLSREGSFEWITNFVGSPSSDFVSSAILFT